MAGPAQGGGIDPVLAAPEPAAAVELRGVGKSYAVGAGRRDVVADCSFVVERHRTTVMIGPSGAGKSTLVRLIAGFERPDAGEIQSGGRPVTGPGRDRLVVFQESALFPWLTTEANILYGPRARGERTAAVGALADALLHKVGLRGFRARYPAQLSGGMQRRTELARALINTPDVMILDEPFRGLDAMTRRLMLEHYVRLSSEAARTSLFVTTDLDEALFLADRLLIMSHRPTRVRAAIAVDLPHPRPLPGLMQEGHLEAIRRQALELLYEEAAKSLAAGGLAVATAMQSSSGRAPMAGPGTRTYRCPE